MPHNRVPHPKVVTTVPTYYLSNTQIKYNIKKWKDEIGRGGTQT